MVFNKLNFKVINLLKKAPNRSKAEKVKQAPFFSYTIKKIYLKTRWQDLFTLFVRLHEPRACAKND